MHQLILDLHTEHISLTTCFKWQNTIIKSKLKCTLFTGCAMGAHWNQLGHTLHGTRTGGSHHQEHLLHFTEGYVKQELLKLEEKEERLQQARK